MDGQATTVTFDQFSAVDIRVGTIVDAQPFPEARKAAWKLVIDFGAELGRRSSSAQITELYAADVLIGRQVLAVVNLGPRRIGPFVSEVLTVGVAGADGAVVLVGPERAVADGARLY